MFDLCVPVFQYQLSGKDAFRENFCCGIERDIVIGFFGFEGEVAEFFLLETCDPAAGFIVVRAVDGLDFVRKKFFQPCEFDRGSEAKMGGDFTGLDLGDFTGDEGGGVSGAGNIVEFSTAISNKSASEVALGDADGELIGKGGKDGFCDVFAVGVEVDVS